MICVKPVTQTRIANFAFWEVPFWFPLHYIMIYTGMRIGEVGGLKWEDVHLEGGYIELKQALSAEYKQGKN